MTVKDSGRDRATESDPGLSLQLLRGDTPCAAKSRPGKAQSGG